MTSAIAEHPGMNMSPAEARMRVDLAAAYRLVALHGWDDHIATHLSARVPGEDSFLINPFGLMFDEITASSLVKIDLEGRILTPTDYSINLPGFTIHSAVHEGRPDAHCVMHLHTLDGIAVSGVVDGLLPLNQSALLVRSQLAFHDYEGVATDLEERRRIVEDLGERNLMMLRNHGTLSVGNTVGEAFKRIYLLERACSMQVRTLSMGLPLYPVDEDAIERTSHVGENLTASAALTWSALVRKLDRLDPGYKL
jgi:ribulose-5-phosphate 4-epimerase/fuculose-1-phosphate aldolase